MLNVAKIVGHVKWLAYNFVGGLLSHLQYADATILVMEMIRIVPFEVLALLL
jgi:hypothetical protein